MSKAILIMEMPISCDSCPLFGNHYSDLCCKALNNRSIDYPYPKDFRQEWCPLSAIPESKKFCAEGCDESEYEYAKGYAEGYNDCIRDINMAIKG